MKYKKLLYGVGVLAVMFFLIKALLSFIYVPVVIMYHSIDENEMETKLSLCPVGFEKQMKFLYDNKYNVVTLGQMLEYIKSRKKIPPKTLAITFDDGFKNNYTCAYPVLKRYGFPATIFVIVSKIGQDEYLSWDDIRDMQKNGISVGSHTVNHLWLPSLDSEKLKYELVESKRILEKNTGQPVLYLAYPLGAYDENVKKAAQEAGYALACGTNPGKDSRWDDVFAIKRIRISRTANNLFVFLCETSGYYTFIKEYRDQK